MGGWGSSNSRHLAPLVIQKILVPKLNKPTLETSFLTLLKKCLKTCWFVKFS